MNDADGSVLLTSAQAGPIVASSVSHAGGSLRSWQLDQVDISPGRSTIATYRAEVDWPYGRRWELIGVCARADGPSGADQSAELFMDGERAVAVWIYPNDPDLPGLARAAYTQSMAGLCNEHGVFSRRVRASELELAMVGYRPRRRAVLKAVCRTTGECVYVKALRPALAERVALRHKELFEAGVPVAEVLARTDDHLLFLAQLPGRPLAHALFDAAAPCRAEDLIELLESLPASVARLPRRAPWTECLPHYAGMVAAALPDLRERLDAICQDVAAGTGGEPPGGEPTHGDFHEGQVHVADGRVVGLLDVDTVGPGRLVDDLACLIAHLSTIQHMHPVQAERVHSLLRQWVPVFDRRVDPVQLRLRAAAVVVTLATGPFRAQEPDWEPETRWMIDSATALLAQVA
ncbi:MAG: aminoglycoside phosphotransferase family protein [Propionibacteriaceae bacterium]|nr:aminoglycoside phosphotransferase family protein [Propionibacteriaceae bacterium]